MGIKGPAGLELLTRGGGLGNIARRLMAANFNPDALRTNDTLRKDEWKAMDDTVVEIAKVRLPGVTDLMSRGLVYPLKNALATMVLEYEDESDMEDAQLNMVARSPAAKDRVETEIKYLPLPIAHKGFDLDIRVLEASRRLGRSLDTTQAAIATRKVSELIETILFTGSSAYTFGGGTLRGYTDHASRNTVTLDANWDASAKTGALILADVIEMKQASITAKHYGPWGLYVPTAYEATLDDDFKANSDLTIRQRILQIENIEFVHVADKLTAHNLVLVELAPETVRIVDGFQPRLVEWDSLGGMLFHFIVMAIMIPQIRADQDGNCGIVHMS